MRKNGKKLLSLVLALILVVGMLPTTALAAEPTSGTCGENVTWKLENGTLTISGTGNMEDYDSISTYAPWTNLRKAITAVTINKGITSIGSTAFYGCSNLTSVTVADSVTTIRGLAFGGCSELSSVEIPHNVTNIGNQAFWGCSSLTNVSIPNSVTQIGNQAFASSGLTNVTIPNSVTSIGDGAFDCCTNLKNVSISEGITRISDQAFRNCSGLTRVRNLKGTS